MGVINLLAGPYIVVVTKRTSVGSVLGHSIYHVDHVEIWPVASESVMLAEGRREEEQEYLRLLRLFLASGGFYYSHGYDLTSTCQSHHAGGTKLSTQTVPFLLFILH